jgi:hypothetical protein
MQDAPNFFSTCAMNKDAINTGTYWLLMTRIVATSSTDRALVDPVSCRLGAI